jgi:hypothetical protein
MLLSNGRTRTQGCHCDGERKPPESVPVHRAPPVVGATETTSYPSTSLNARTFNLTLDQCYRALPSPGTRVGPGPSYSWLQDIELDLRADAKPKRRHEFVTSDQLLEAGEALSREAELASHLSPKDQAVLARNGLMIALLAVHPIRHKNLTELDLGDSFRRVERWWIVLEATETKVDERRQVPDYLTPTVERYLTTFRPILLSQAADTLPETGPLWVSVPGDRLT